MVMETEKIMFTRDCAKTKMSTKEGALGQTAETAEREGATPGCSVQLCFS